jgi:hypothetical protein
VRTPHSCVIGLFGIAKLEIHTLSLPSTTTAHGPGIPPFPNGEPGNSLPSGLSNVMLPASPLCSDIIFVTYSAAESTCALSKDDAGLHRSALAHLRE